MYSIQTTISQTKPKPTRNAYACIWTQLITPMHITLERNGTKTPISPILVLQKYLRVSPSQKKKKKKKKKTSLQNIMCTSLWTTIQQMKPKSTWNACDFNGETIMMSQYSETM